MTEQPTSSPPVYMGELTDELLSDVLEEVEREAAGFPCTDMLWAQVAFLEELQRRRAADHADAVRRET
jgi:hypothetical protein